MPLWDRSKVLVTEVENQTDVDITHNKGRNVMVTYLRRSDLQQAVVSYRMLDENTVRVSTIDFMDGYILVL